MKLGLSVQELLRSPTSFSQCKGLSRWRRLVTNTPRPWFSRSLHSTCGKKPSVVWGLEGWARGWSENLPVWCTTWQFTTCLTSNFYGFHWEKSTESELSSKPAISSIPPSPLTVDHWSWHRSGCYRRENFLCSAQPPYDAHLRDTEGLQYGGFSRHCHRWGRNSTCFFVWFDCPCVLFGLSRVQCVDPRVNRTTTVCGPCRVPSALVAVRESSTLRPSASVEDVSLSSWNMCFVLSRKLIIVNCRNFNTTICTSNAHNLIHSVCGTEQRARSIFMRRQVEPKWLTPRHVAPFPSQGEGAPLGRWPAARVTRTLLLLSKNGFRALRTQLVMGVFDLRARPAAGPVASRHPWVGDGVTPAILARWAKIERGHLHAENTSQRTSAVLEEKKFVRGKHWPGCASTAETQFCRFSWLFCFDWVKNQFLFRSPATATAMCESVRSLCVHLELWWCVGVHFCTFSHNNLGFLVFSASWAWLKMAMMEQNGDSEKHTDLYFILANRQRFNL